MYAIHLSDLAALPAVRPLRFLFAPMPSILRLRLTVSPVSIGAIRGDIQPAAGSPPERGAHEAFRRSCVNIMAAWGAL